MKRNSKPVSLPLFKPHGWLAALLVASAAMVPASCGKKEAGGPGGGPPGGFAITVETADVKQEDWILFFDTVGALEADEQVTIRNAVAGFVTSIDAREGDPVDPGALIATIDPETYTLEVNRAEAAFREADANLKRKKPLFEEGLLSESEFVDAEARAEAAQADVGLARKRLTDSRITAPFKGRLGRRHVSPGDYAQVGSALFELVKMDILKLEFSVPARYLAQLKKGMQATFTTPSIPGKSFTGSVTFIDPVIDISTRSVRARAIVDNPQEELKPNLFGNVKVQVGTLPGALLVPEEAVISTLGSSSVFVVEDGKALRREITIAERARGVVVISDGLTPGAAVVTAGHQKLRDQAPVQTSGAPD